MKKNEKLIEMIGEIDDDLIPDINKKKPKRNIIKWVSIGGGLCAAAAIGIFAVNSIKGVNTPPVDVPDVTTGISTDAPVTDTAPDNIIISENNEIGFDRTRKSTVITDIIANALSGNSALTNTSFTIKANKDISADELSEKLTLTPNVDFTLTKSADFEYILSAKQEFAKGSVVKLAVESDEGGLGDCYAFQIVDDFRIKSVYPSDKSENVWPGTGIEIEFSESVNLASAKEHFSIKPYVDGEFALNGNTLCFIPKENLRPYVFYSVSVTEGIEASSGSVLKEGKDFSFKTTTADGTYFYTTCGVSETFIMGDPVVISVYGNTNTMNLPIDTKLYRYNGGDDYMSDLDRYSKDCGEEIDLSALTEVFSSNEKPTSGNKDGEIYKPYYVMLPYDLEEGYYVAELQVNDMSALYFFEMNPISVYTASLGDKNLFFINDALTGKPASGAEITLHTKDKDYKATVKADGTAEIVTGDNCTRSDMLEINYDGHRYIDSVTNYSFYKQTYSDLFFTYIYTDREIYQTTDVINVWGVIKPRRAGAVVPNNLYLSFGEGWQENSTSGKFKKIEVSPDGTFTTSIEYADRAVYWGSMVTLLDGDNNNAVITCKHVSVMDYVKPTYTFDLSIPEYAILPQEQPFDVSVTASYFDGTPAENLVFTTSCPTKPSTTWSDTDFSDVSDVPVEDIYEPSVVCDDEDDYNASKNDGAIVTDENGYGEGKYYIYDEYSWEPRGSYVSFELTGIENEYQYVYDGITAFHRDVMFTGGFDKDTKKFTVNLNRINFDKIPEYIEANKSSNYVDYYTERPNLYDIFKGAPYDTSVKIFIERRWTEKEEAYSYYDFLEKKTVKVYNYANRSETIGEFTVNTVNGTATLNDVTLDNEVGRYYITVEYRDSGNRVTEDYYNITNTEDSHFWFYTDYKIYQLNAKTSFKENEDVTFTLRNIYGASDEKLEGKVFFIAHQNDVLDATVYDGTSFVYKTEDKCVPTFRYCGAYFDGRHVYSISDFIMYFDPEDRKITVDVSSDRDKYDAGDEVTLTISARDGSGKAVSGALISLSVVDEAAFAVLDQSVDTLSSMYKGVDYSCAYQSCSYIQHSINGEGGSEMGGPGTDEGVRKDFRDNPYFGTATTDSNGKAVITFKLADTITTWRATVQAVGEVNNRLYAGNKAYPIVATRPVFVTPIMLSEYIAGDDIAVTAKAVGLKRGELISVTLDGTDKTIDILPCATANFGTLPAREYTMTFRASSGGNSDAIQLPFKVKDTKHEVWVGKDVPIDKLSGISPTKWPVYISFFDKEQLFCKSVLESLSFYGGDRFDMRVAAMFAANELGYFETDYNETIASATNNGFAKLFKNGEENLEMTAMLCAAFPDGVEKEAVAAAFMEKLKDCDYNDLAYCYMGLAAVGKPVLGDIKRILDDYSDKLNVTQKLYLVAGLALGGDYNGAYTRYNEITKDMRFYEKDGKPYAALETARESKAALLTASALNLPEAEPIARTLSESKSKQESFALELVVFVRNYVPKSEGGASFSYSINGERKTVDLDKYGRYVLPFDKEQFENADFRTESGEVLTYARYLGKVDEIDAPQSITVNKKYYDPNGDSIKTGDIITVTITAEPYSVIEDIIPSGARLCGKPDADIYYVSNGQHIQLYTGYRNSVSYKIRAATSGEYVTEGAYAYTYTEDGEFKWGISSGGTIKISSSNEDI